MRTIKRTLYHLAWIIRGMHVFALVGQSGTGKSFRAQLIAQKYGIELIIDDGLLIHDQKIIGGKSAKHEPGVISSIKIALFHDRDHLSEVLRILERGKFKRILIIGTSVRMVERIAERLMVPVPSKIVRIEDIANQDEIEAALSTRKDEGKHIIPVPAIEVKRDYPHIVIDSIKIFLKNGLRRSKKGTVFEKTVVNPGLNARGTISISEAALSQMVLHCVNEFEPKYHVEKLVFELQGQRHDLEIILRVPIDVPVAGKLHELRDYVIRNVARFSGVFLGDVSITLARFEENGESEHDETRSVEETTRR